MEEWQLGFRIRSSPPLKENNKALSSRTSSGYGHFADSRNALQAKQFENPSAQRLGSTPSISRKPVASNNRDAGPPPPPKDNRDIPRQQQSQPSTYPSTTRTNQRPVAPPKPKSLQTGEHSDPTRNTSRSDSAQLPPDNSTTPKEDWETNFSRRYPSLSGIEMVETEIDIPRHLPTLRTKEV
jgi:AP2-associated kinase